MTKQLPVALVTGGNSGIGLAVVQDLARDHQVYALGRRALQSEALAALPQVTPVGLDLLDSEALAAWATTLPRLDVLVHAAAISLPFSVADASLTAWREHFELNLFAPAELTRLTLPALRASRGQVVFINSGSGTRPQAGHAVYSASKFALHALAEALRNEEREQGVRVATVYPGPTDTPMNLDAAQQRQRGQTPDPLAFSTPQSIAKAVRVIVDTSEDSQITEVTVRPRLDPARR